MKKQPTLMKMEGELYNSDRWAWSIYTALRHAPGKEEKAILWAMMTPDQKAGLKIIAKHAKGVPA